MRIDDPDHVTVPPDGLAASDQPEWRRAFPIDWPQDEYRTRREFARFLLLISVAFVMGQAWIVARSVWRRVRGQPPVQEIVALDALPVRGMRLFEYPAGGEKCVLVRLTDANFVAFGQKCTHLSCPVIPRPAEGRFHCPCHEGSFDLLTGRPLSGPPRRPLPRVTLLIQNGRVYATGLEAGQT
jgi:Rieske Fe-S protein